MDSYITLCLLIMPGYLARVINHHLCDSIVSNNKFDTIMESLLYDIVIIPLVYIIIRLLTPEIDDISSFFMNMNNVIIYGICSIVVSILLGWLSKYLIEIYQNIINRLRDNDNKITIGKSIYNMNFNDGKVHLIEVYKDNTLLYKGILSNMYFDNKELLLEDANEEFKLIEQYGQLVYKKTYINWESGIMIREVDIENCKK
ncbi:hypothetical protein SAMN02745671_01221 [Anaerovibrio lipolyticus DSM 3074]|uniref:Uncharacterized protein n=2 Tax=Anaerovibrio lipolyticus TaxID=82374 RepID=A0A0B2K0I0_9FIRM|nr:hypothetical protein [Anaerovibrio lipolyticus]KHM52468.1 hypothetical protein NZ47_04650 [Anaerovibrio lipolyticus]SHI64574.1 hypothetical protein SAMN02745671_01221 [Anaerovibrio lipolyticus DSM 3074]